MKNEANATRTARCTACGQKPAVPTPAELQKHTRPCPGCGRPLRVSATRQRYLRFRCEQAGCLWANVTRTEAELDAPRVIREMKAAGFFAGIDDVWGDDE